MTKTPGPIGPNDPLHAILDVPHWHWTIVGLNWQMEPNDNDQPYLDLRLARDRDRRTLRFENPQMLSIEEGGPTVTNGFAIFDVSAHGLERLSVYVTDLENCGGKVRFWAQGVTDLSDTRSAERAKS